MEITKLFTQKEVNKIFSHIPSKTLRWWGMRDLYGWADQINDGRGIHRLYKLGNLYQIGIVEEELSSLNIQMGTINRIMCEHFRSGLGMLPPLLTEDLEIEVREWPFVNVVIQMDKILVISRRLRGGFRDKLGIRGRLMPDWESFLVNRTEATGIGPEGELRDGIMIVIDLQKIKQFVDFLLSQT